MRAAAALFDEDGKIKKKGIEAIALLQKTCSSRSFPGGHP